MPLVFLRVHSSCCRWKAARPFEADGNFELTLRFGSPFFDRWIQEIKAASLSATNVSAFAGCVRFTETLDYKYESGQTDDGNKNSREDESVVEHRVRANGNPLTTLKISLLWYPFAP